MPVYPSSLFISSRHRGSQAIRLVDELRGTALGLASSSSLFADAGVQLVADALTERPPPRDYTTTPDKTTGVFRRSPSNASEPPQANGGVEDIPHIPTASEKKKATRAGAGNLVTDHCSSLIDRQSGETRLVGAHADVDVVVVAAGRSSGDYSAVEVAAKKEEQTASARISSFLWRRRQERLVDDVNDVPEPKDPAKLSTGSMMGAVTDEQPPPSSSSGGGGGSGWLGAAVLALRKAIDIFLLGERTEGPNTLLADGASSDGRNNTTTAVGIPSEEGPRKTDQVSRVCNTDRGKTGMSKTLDDSNTDCGYGGRDGDDDSTTTFSQVPLRARVPSLYTLPPPGGSWGAATRNRGGDRGGGDGGGGAGDGAGSTTNNTISGGLFTKLDPAVAARLYSARSVFALRAADVLAVFSPPPPVPVSRSPFEPSAREDISLSRPSTAPPAAAATGSGGRHRRKLSSDALRRHLHMEAADASRTGLGRPWGLPKWPSPTGGGGAINRRKKRPSAFQKEHPTRQEVDVEEGDCDVEQQSREKRRRLLLSGPCTALGRRLLAKRQSIVRAARRKSMMGEMDTCRARHACRQSGSGAAVSALEGVGRVLDTRLSVAREKRVSLAQMELLVDAFDGSIFSDSQVRLCECS